MKTEVTKVTERGQVSIPAAVRKRLGLAAGRRVSWEVLSDQVCRITTVDTRGARVGAAAMLGFAKTFRKTRTTAAWMRELRAGEGH
jgi:AbrB family looped-hinge helix DNA binding protein